MEAKILLDKPRIRIDFNECCGNSQSNDPVYLLSQADIVKNSEGNDVELYEGMEISVFDNDFDESGKPDAVLADGIVIKNTLKNYPMVKWLIKLTKNKVTGGAEYAYWLSDLKRNPYH